MDLVKRVITGNDIDLIQIQIQGILLSTNGKHKNDTVRERFKRIMNINMLAQQHRKQKLSCYIFSMGSFLGERENLPEIMKNTNSNQAPFNFLST